MGGTAPPGFFPLLPRGLSSERAVLRLMRDSSALGAVEAPGEGPSSRTQLSTALFILLGSRPYTNCALIEELLERGAEPTYGRLLADSVARRLGIEASHLSRGGNYAERIGPSLRALEQLGVLEHPPEPRPGRGGARLFRLDPDKTSLVRSVVSAFRDGRGLPWVHGEDVARAQVHVERARDLNRNRDFGEAAAEASRARIDLEHLAGTSPAAADARILQGELLWETAEGARSRGHYRQMLGILREATRLFREARERGADPDRVARGLCTVLGALGDLQTLRGSRVAARRALAECHAINESLLDRHGPSWTVRRNESLTFLAEGTGLLMAGRLEEGLRRLERAERIVGELRSDADEAAPRNQRANLEMNQSRVAVIQAIGLLAAGDPDAARRSARRGSSAAATAVRTLRRPNIVLYRRLGIALRTQAWLYDEIDAGTVAAAEARRKSAWAFERSLAALPFELDSIVEYARLLRRWPAETEPVAGQRRARRLAELLADPRVRATDHPGLRLDPGSTRPAPSSTDLFPLCWAIPGC